MEAQQKEQYLENVAILSTLEGLATVGRQRGELEHPPLPAVPALVTHKHQLLVLEAKQTRQQLENVAIL